MPAGPFILLLIYIAVMSPFLAFSNYSSTFWIVSKSLFHDDNCYNYDNDEDDDDDDDNDDNNDARCRCFWGLQTSSGAIPNDGQKNLQRHRDPSHPATLQTLPYPQITNYK